MEMTDGYVSTVSNVKEGCEGVVGVDVGEVADGR